MEAPSRVSTPSSSTISKASSITHSPPRSPDSDYGFASGVLGFESSEERYILVTGGLGYIGSHTALELLKTGHNVVIIDDLSNSYLVVLNRIKTLVDQHYADLDRKSIPTLDFHQIDYRNTVALRAVLDHYALRPWALQSEQYTANRSKITGVIHFAAYKSVAESIQIPLSYYSNNVGGFIGLLEVLSGYGIKRLVFRSSATVFGTISQEESGGISEEYCVHAEEMYYKDAELMRMAQGCRGLTSPYGRTKWMCEAILWDLCISDP